VKIKILIFFLRTTVTTLSFFKNQFIRTFQELWYQKQILEIISFLGIYKKVNSYRVSETYDNILNILNAVFRIILTASLTLNL